MINYGSLLFFLGSLVCLAFPPRGACEALGASVPQVVVTLKPLHSLVTSVMKGRGIPVLLLEGALSPHTAQVRPQQLILLKTADLVVWVGPTFEMFLSKTIAARSQGASLALLQEAGLHLLPQGDMPCCSEHQGSEHPHQHGPHTLWDGHIWMSPQNGMLIARAVAQHLVRLDPEGRSVYEANLENLEETLQKLDQEIALMLEPFRDLDFLVAHQAYAYFVERYHLRRPKALLVHPEQSIRPQESQMIHKPLAGICVFFEPQFRGSLAKVENQVTRSGGCVSELDPLGADLPEGPGMFEALLRKCSQAMVACFSQKR